jgi:hypothetical protein
MNIFVIEIYPLELMPIFSFVIKLFLRIFAIAQQERLEKQQKEKLAAYLRSLGINPDEI